MISTCDEPWFSLDRSWVSADGQYEYNLQYDGEIADAIKIANSFSAVK